MNQIPQYVVELSELSKEYEKQFGEGTLDRVILPVDIDAEEAFRSSIKKMKKAMETNTPLEQLTQEEWDRLIF